MSWVSEAALVIMACAILAVASRLMSPHRLTRLIPPLAEVMAPNDRPRRPLWQDIVLLLIVIGATVVVGLYIFGELPQLELPRWLRAAIQAAIFALAVVWRLTTPWLKRLLVALPVLAAAEFWLVIDTWWSLDLAGLVICTGAVLLTGRLLARRSVLFQFAMGGLLVAYDIYVVFVTATMQESVISNFRSERPVPGSFVIPDLSIPGMGHSLGFGDVYLPGALVMTAVYLAHRYRDRRFWWGALWGYFVGQLMAVAAVMMTEAAQPATLYLVPCTAAGLWLGARQAGVCSRCLLGFQAGRDWLGYKEHPLLKA